ncbi:RHS repeat-associated core domain-containing protein [Capnocytophaga gingivalis]
MASTFRFVWDGNVLLHETFKKDNSKNTELTTWVFEGFVPTAKLVNGKAYSIISDHLGTPILAIDSDGMEVWNRQLDIYGRVRKENKHSSLGDEVFPFVPFLYQGQYYDFETNLAYNRFRYYSPETGAYISQDPIRLRGGNPNLYAYVADNNWWGDIFGLIIVYHGTTLEGANSIRQNGVDLSKGNKNRDFNSKGKGAFYVSESLADTEEYNKYKSKKEGGATTTTVKLEIPDEELNNLKIKVFESGDKEWGDFVEAARQGKLEHDYDLVKGPKVANPKGVSNGIEKPEVLDKGTQIAITSEKAAKLIKCID